MAAVKSSPARKKKVDLLNKIEDGLFLGSLAAASDPDVLAKNKINVILTLDTCPIPMRVIKTLKHYKFVAVCDTVKDNLLSHFEECIAFIEDSRKTGNVLVHCYFGISRSSSVVIAYLMSKYQLTSEEALQRVVACRSMVSPNQGFVAQLKLFQEMSYRLEWQNNLRYKIFAMATAADRLKKEHGIPKILASMIMPDPAEILASANHSVEAQHLYRCASCRRVVATQKNVIPHMRNHKHVWTDARFNDLVESKHQICRHGLFLEPIAWMKNAFDKLQGKLHCPNCDAKLGNFTWLLGVACSCSTKIVPAFQLHEKKVDKMMYNPPHHSISMPALANCSANDFSAKSPLRKKISVPAPEVPFEVLEALDDDAGMDKPAVKDDKKENEPGLVDLVEVEGNEDGTNVSE